MIWVSKFGPFRFEPHQYIEKTSKKNIFNTLGINKEQINKKIDYRF